MIAKIHSPPIVCHQTGMRVFPKMGLKFSQIFICEIQRKRSGASKNKGLASEGKAAGSLKKLMALILFFNKSALTIPQGFLFSLEKNGDFCF
jgi:hypothetical protein